MAAVQIGRCDSSTDDSTKNNLEYFPYKVLVEIFAGVDDIGLVHLANISCRFDGFAKIVFRKRYAHKYFVIDTEFPEQQEAYREQFRRFGRCIKAIEVNNIHDLDGTHWMIEMWADHTADLEKLAFNGCTFRNATELFARHLNLTHLTLQQNVDGTDDNFIFPNYRKLRELKLCNFSNISLQTVQQIARDNPQLECLNVRYCENITLPEIMKLVANHLNNLKHLALLDDHDFDHFPPAECSIERFVNAVNRLQSLALIVDNELNELLWCLGQKCKSVRRLELRHLGYNMDSEMVAAILAFENVEDLILTQATYDDQFEKLVEYLPHLRSLSIDMFKPIGNGYILTLLRKCAMLEQLTLIYDYDRDECAPYVNGQFYAAFLDIVGQRPVRIEFNEYGRAVCYVTNTEIVWRNMRTHWIGYDAVQSRSNVQLLDLATAQTDRKRSPFDLILDHLDLSSLYSLYRVNKKSKQLIDAFIQECSKNESHRFICTDEFHCDRIVLCPFRQYVHNLEVKLIYHRSIQSLRSDVEQNYKHLNELYFRSKLDTRPQDFVVAQMRKFVFNSDGFQNYSYLNEILSVCRYLETIEFVNAVEFAENQEEFHSYPCCALKKFVFKPTDDEQIAFIKEFFKNKPVEVVVKQ